MNLDQVLRLESMPRLALVGAGGKTTALFQLARLLPSPIFVTTTTHLGIWQVELADKHIRIHNINDLPGLLDEALEGVILVTGDVVREDRITGLSLEVVDKLLSIVDRRKLPLLIEADGSRQKPLKAPAEHEPVIPAFANMIIVVAGLSGLGKPINAQWVHRSGRFVELSGSRNGEIITPGLLANVLLHPEGGLKGIPPGARRVVLLNQVDTIDLRRSAGELAARLIPAYQAVIIASLNPPDATLSPTIYETHERVAGIVLAAGEGRRFAQSGRDTPKQLLIWDGMPLVRHVTLCALQAGLSPVVLVTGANAPDVQVAISDLPVKIVHNPSWESGQSSSLQAGLNILPYDVGSTVFLLADQPQVTPDLVRLLVEMHSQTLAPMVAPLVEGKRANPILFDRVTFSTLLTLSGDVGGRALFSSNSKYPVAWVPWDDPDMLMDVDTEFDYQVLLGRKVH